MNAVAKTVIFRFSLIFWNTDLRRDIGQRKEEITIEKTTSIWSLSCLTCKKKQSSQINLSSANRVGSVSYESTRRRQLVIILGIDFS